MLPRLLLIPLALGLVLTAPCRADDETPPQVLEPVTVQGMRAPFQLHYGRLLLARAAFEENKARAPQASLRFMARGQTADGAALRLELNADGVSHPLALNEQGAFSLPTLDVQDPEGSFVVANRSAKKLRVHPFVRSEGLPANAYRMGDLRIECAIAWAMSRDDVSMWIRAGFAAAGGACKSAKIAFFLPTPRPLRTASLQVDGKATAVALAGAGKQWRPPLHDATVPDDALIWIEALD